MPLMNKFFYGNSNRKLRSFLFLIFLFILATVIHPVVAEVSSPTPIVQTESNPSELVKQAQVLYKEQEYEDALLLWESAAKGFAKMGDQENSAIALSNLSLTNQKLGRWDAAHTAIESSLKLLETESVSSSSTLAHTLDIQGKLQRETGKSAEAIETWQQAAKIYKKNNNTTALNQNNLNQAKALQDLGLYPRACKRILDTLPIDNISTCKQLSKLPQTELQSKLKLITSKPSLDKVSALRNLGNLLFILGQSEQSEEILEASLTSAKKLDSPQELSLTYLRIGNTYQALAQAENHPEGRRNLRTKYEKKALNAYNHIVKLSASSTTQLKAKLNKLNLRINQKKWTEAESIWRSLYPQIANSNASLSQDRIYANINYVQNLIRVLTLEDQTIPNSLQLPSNSELQQILIQATQQAKTLGDKRIEAHAWGTLGRLEEVKSEYSNAEIETKKALNLVSNYNASDITYQYFWQLGRIQKEQNNIPHAIASYTKAYGALQSLRKDIATINPEVQFSFRDEVEPVYRQLVELDIKYAEILNTQGQKEESKTRLIQARNVVESLQVAQLNNFFREACIEGNPQQIDEIDPNAAVIYTIFLEDKLEILLSLPNKSPIVYQADATKTEISDVVETIQNYLKNSPPNPKLTEKQILQQFQKYYDDSILPLETKLYDWLIRPLETKLEENEVKTIAFVLDGKLGNIPMSILHDSKQYLVEKYALALTPSLQLLDPQALTEIQLDAFTGGLGEMNPDVESHRKFGDLENVRVELGIIEKLELSKSSLLNDKFTKKAIKQNITTSGSPIVHFATHGQFSSNAEDTFLLSWDGQINIKELDDMLRDDAYNRKNDVELLVLSACETASGDSRATLGLAGVAVQAGARSTLATLWPVVDQSTALMMDEFYGQLKKSEGTQINKAEILQQAQKSLIKNKEFNHPHFWASFVLVGNWK